MKKSIQKSVKNQKGNVGIEYILILALVVGLVIAFKSKLQSTFTTGADKVDQQMSNFNSDFQ